MSSTFDSLAQITTLALQSQQAEMAGLLRREDDLRRNLAQLTASKTAQAQSTRAPDEAAFVAGADVRWHQWVDQRRASINTELAQVLVLKENCRTKLQLAFGRDQAAQSLQDRHAMEQKTMIRRRAAYES